MADKQFGLRRVSEIHKNMNAKTKLTSKSGPLRRAVSMLLFGAAAAAALWAIMPPRALSQSHAQDQSADLSGAAALPTKNEKGRYVYDTLRNKSQATQGPILQWLRERGIEHQSFYIV